MVFFIPIISLAVIIGFIILFMYISSLITAAAPLITLGIVFAALWLILSKTKYGDKIFKR